MFPSISSHLGVPLGGNGLSLGIAEPQGWSFQHGNDRALDTSQGRARVTNSRARGTCLLLHVYSRTEAWHSEGLGRAGSTSNHGCRVPKLAGRLGRHRTQTGLLVDKIVSASSKRRLHHALPGTKSQGLPVPSRREGAVCPPWDERAWGVGDVPP